MIFNIKHTANWEYIRQRKKNLINKKNKRDNAGRVISVYKIGEKVLLRGGNENKYESPYQGPIEILKVNDNGTVRLTVNSVTDTLIQDASSLMCQRTTLISGENAICGFLRSVEKTNNARIKTKKYRPQQIHL